MSVASEQMFHVGDRALYAFAGQDVEVEVVEERGPLGAGGRHLVGILLPMDFAEPYEMTVPETDLRPVTDAA